MYESIIKEHGRPLHLQEITQEALARGVEFKGSAGKEPAAKVRDSLFGAAKRFVNLGDNTWWLVGRDLPEEQPQRGDLSLTDARSNRTPRLLQ